VDTVIAIPNDRLLTLLPRGTTFCDGVRSADDVLRQAVQGISDIITTPGMINRDFSDIKATMLGMGFAMMGTAVARGENAAAEAARQAITCPLLEEGGINGARGILINITGSSTLGLHEVNEACTLIAEATHNDDVQVSFGVVLDEEMGESVKVTVIATGFNRPEAAAVARKAVPKAPEKTAWAPRPEPEPEPQMAPPPPPPPPVLGPPVHEPGLRDDLDIPAYQRRERLLF